MQSIETYLKDAPFDNAKVAGWVNSICEDCIHGLVDLGKPFKYIGEQTSPATRAAVGCRCHWRHWSGHVRRLCDVARADRGCAHGRRLCGPRNAIPWGAVISSSA